MFYESYANNFIKPNTKIDFIHNCDNFRVTTVIFETKVYAKNLIIVRITIMRNECILVI